MHFSYQLPPLLLLALTGLGCGAHRGTADHHYEALKADITRLQADQDRILERLEGLEARKGPNPREEQVASGDRPPLKVVVLQPESEEADDLGEADEPEDNDAPRTLVRVHGNHEAGGRKAKKEDSKPEADAERDYQEALSLLKKKQHRRALELFTAFQVRYPANPRIETALFWMAECYEALGDLPRAIEYYEAVIARFPQGSKTPDALLRLATYHKKHGADARARELLLRLRSDFPQSESTRRAPKD
ncbi:MAG: tetratricopeptide repeat protein [Myxococcales bacterium]|nr:tetratricopeptide repeat protein [Polyangiaceae bacterium]MDW8250318.1 tetratricopeptide repeat protein [Myxococcales bacterium]